MAKNSLIPFNDDSNAMPAHLQGVLGSGVNNELSGGVSSGYPVISFKGKTWTVREGENSTIVMKPDDEDEIATSLEVVIAKANPNLSKVYYEGGYTEGSTDKPACYSNDGIKPAADAAEPQCGTCAACPHNAWGSRISENGSKGKACSDSRRIAVVPSGELDRPMLLRVPAATLKDLAQYASMLTKRNAPYQAVVTKIGFDPTVAHPKLTFKAVRWLSADEAEQISETMKSDVVAQIIGVAPSAGALAASEQVAATPVATKPKAAPAASTKAAVNPVPETQPEDVSPPPAKPKGKPMAAAKVAPKPAPPESKVAAKVVEASDDLDAALAELDDL